MAQLESPLSSKKEETKLPGQVQQARVAGGLQEYAITGTVIWDSAATTESFQIYVKELGVHFTGKVTDVPASGQADTTPIVGAIDTVDAIAAGTEDITCHASNCGLYITFYDKNRAAKHWLTASPVPGWADGVSYTGSGTWA